MKKDVIDYSFLNSMNIPDSYKDTIKKEIDKQVIKLDHKVEYYRRDSLTNFLLRKDFDKDIIKLINSKSSNYIIFLDINRLHYVNDTYGYEAGDKYIKSISKAIIRKIKNNILESYRIGGDEFAIILKKPIDLYIRNTIYSMHKINEYNSVSKLVYDMSKNISILKREWYKEHNLDRRN